MQVHTFYSFRSLEGMGFGIPVERSVLLRPMIDAVLNLQNVVVQADNAWITVQKIEVLEGFRKPE